MYLCLSSGSTPQYRQDIISALAMPTGTRLQFRYQDRWVSQPVRDKIRAGRFQADTTIVAYIDQSDKTAIPRIVPCRLAKLVDPRSHGSTYTLKLELGSFCYAADLDKFNRELRAAAADLPSYVNGNITGLYWLELPEPKSITQSSDLGDWEKIVKQLAATTDFSTESVFFHASGIRSVADRNAVVMEEGDFVVKADADYEIDFYHLHPTAFAAAELDLETGSTSVSFITNPKMELASRYDLHEIRFHVADPSQDATSGNSHALLSVYRTQSGTREWFFDIPLRIRRRIWRRILVALILGAVLAVSPVIAALTNDKLTGSSMTVVIVGAVVSSILAGFVAVYGIPKSI
jgi:hypothetical protein